jgi:hypothetical protein
MQKVKCPIDAIRANALRLRRRGKAGPHDHDTIRVGPPVRLGSWHVSAHGSGPAGREAF